jgi:hypothetical protein
LKILAFDHSLACVFDNRKHSFTVETAFLFTLVKACGFQYARLDEELLVKFHPPLSTQGCGYNKENIEDDRQRKAIDGIIKALDTVLFADDGLDFMKD